MNTTILALIWTASSIGLAIVSGVLLGLWDTRRIRAERERE